MMKIEFYKLQASGNDFILLDNLKVKNKPSATFYRKFAKKYCSRKLGIGADGLLVIEPSKKANFKMRIFNVDGSEAEMCGNGARSVGLWASLVKSKKNVKFESEAGIIEAKVEGKGKSARVKIKTSVPFGLKMDLSLSGRKMKVNFINTGVPHTVIFVEGLEKININKIGREVRFHKQFKPAGTNVNFVEIKSKDSLSIRTYERGVEAETLACGTGTIAAAIIFWFKLNPGLRAKKAISIFVKTKNGDILRVTFDVGRKVSNVWLEGEAYLVYRGEITN